LLTQAKLDREAADLRAADASRLAGFDGAMAYLAVLGAEQVVTAAERRVELARTSLADAKARTSAGLAGTNDVTRAALELASAERDLARARGEVDATRLALGHLIGSPVDGPLVVPDALLEDTRRSAPAADTLVPNTRKRLDVAAAGKSADALGAGADEPLLRTLPTFALLGELRKTNDSGPSAHDWDGLVGVSLTWVLFDGGERYAERAERDALARAGTLDAEGLARRAELELRDAASALRTGQAAAAQAEAAVRAAEQNSREASELYKNGLATSLAVADAGVQLFTAYIDLVRARYGVAQSLLEVRRAAGLDALGGSPR
jgi:outer membrane protein TolC